jgi:methionyl-tRNA formyltransferase
MNNKKPTLVFFGMDSLFSGVLLRALCRAELTPALVINGVSQPRTRRSPIVRYFPVKPRGHEAVKSYLGLKRPHRLAANISSEANLIETAQQYRIDAVLTSDTNALRVRARLNALAPDLFVIGGFPSLLGPQVLQMAKRGGLNVHPGKLPQERGPAPLFWALKRGASSLSFAVHVLDEGEDTGDIISQGTYEFVPGTHGRDLLKLGALEAAPHLIRAVSNMWSGDIVRTPQPKVGVGRCPRPKYRDNLIDPSMSAEQVYNFVTGCAGVYPLFAECGGDRFFIQNASSYSMSDDLPCEFMLVGDRMLLRCYPGMVELTLKPDGGAVFSGEYIARDEEP